MKAKTPEPAPQTFPDRTRVRVTDGGPFHGQTGEFVGVKASGWTRVILTDANVPGRSAPVRTEVIVRAVERV